MLDPGPTVWFLRAKRQNAIGFNIFSTATLTRLWIGAKASLVTLTDISVSLPVSATALSKLSRA